MNIVETLTDPLLIAGVLAAGACFATIVTVAAPSLAADKLGSRLKEVAKKREELRKRSRAELAKGVGSLQHKDANSFAKSLVDKLNLTLHWLVAAGVGAAVLTLAVASLTGLLFPMSASAISREGSLPLWQRATRAASMSKPMLRRVLPNSTTSGSPT